MFFISITFPNTSTPTITITINITKPEKNCIPDLAQQCTTIIAITFIINVSNTFPNSLIVIKFFFFFFLVYILLLQ